MPEWKSQKLVADQDLGKTSFNLVYRGLLVKLGNLASVSEEMSQIRAPLESITRTRMRSASTSPAFRLPTRCRSSGHAFLRRPFGLVTDSAQVAGERAIDDYFQLGSKVFALSLPSRGGQLQVLGSDRIIS